MKDLILNLLPDQFLRSIKKIYLKMRGYYYIGNKYNCPICEYNFRKMLPGGFDLDVIKEKNIIGGGRRNNNICPNCQSTDRDRLVFMYLKHETEIFKNKVKILHIGPEPSLYNRLKKHSNIFYVTGVKYTEGIYYHKDIDTMDLLELPSHDGEYDMVICNHILEHIINDTKAMSEIYRVLSHNGIAILQVPLSNLLETSYEDYSITCPKLREKHFGQFDHVRIYGKDYVKRLENAGFKVQSYYPVFNDITDELNRFALNKDEKLIIAHKKK
ncbi:MAG: methyltransferase domain-containing protein [Bacteroidetes bacterium]|nr:methyltransferase domain-containing protein [Bacteroidota bacterium]